MQPPLNLLLKRKHLLQDFVWSDVLSQGVFSSWLQSLNDKKCTQLLVEGGPSLGKTHLLLAVCQHARKNGLSSRYIDLSDQTSDLIDNVTQVYCLDNVDAVTKNPEFATSIVDFIENARSKDRHLMFSINRNTSIGLADLQTRLHLGLSLRLAKLNRNQKVEALRIRAKSAGLKVSNTLMQVLVNSEMDNHKLFSSLSRLDEIQLSSHQRLNQSVLEQLNIKK